MCEVGGGHYNFFVLLVKSILSILVFKKNLICYFTWFPSEVFCQDRKRKSHKLFST